MHRRYLPRKFSGILVLSIKSVFIVSYSRDFSYTVQEYVPLLEHFFEENPFPTRADKLFLAKKSNMQYRQIHVWVRALSLIVVSPGLTFTYSVSEPPKPHQKGGESVEEEAHVRGSNKTTG